MSVTCLDYNNTSNTRLLVRRDSKDSCYSEEMTDDLSSTHVEDGCRLSPLAATLSRKSSTSGDSGVSMDYEAELLRDNALKARNVTDSSKVAFSVGDNHSINNTSQVVDRLALLEQKLKEMETMLRGETERRVQLEKKVTKLEEENEKLVSSRTLAVTQLQSFSEKFFAMPEPKHISPVGTPPLNSPKLQSPRALQSPRHSHLELRRISSNSSVVSRLSGHSFPPVTSRFSNISL